MDYILIKSNMAQDNFGLFAGMESRSAKSSKKLTDLDNSLCVSLIEDLKNLQWNHYCSRWGQRLVLAFALQFGWPLVSADVSEAFLRGIPFKQLADLDKSQPLRVVKIALPPGTAGLLRSFPGMETYDATTECLSMCWSLDSGWKAHLVYGTWLCKRCWKNVIL